MIYSFIVFLIHITCCYSKKYLSNYTLTPLAHGYYFSNSPKLNWYMARKNCLYYQLELASIFDEEDYINIQDAFLIHPICKILTKNKNHSKIFIQRDTFIGEPNGLFLSALGEQPWNANKFAWDVNGSTYQLIDYAITKKLWAPKQPDNYDTLEQCVSVYMLSDEDIHLGLNDIQCGWTRGFLCEIPTPPGEYIAPKPKYNETKGDNDVHVIRVATWAKAVQECAGRNRTQPILSTPAAIENFIKTYYDAGYLESSEAVWTSASSLGQLGPADLKTMPNAMKFRWPDHRLYGEIPKPKEQCLAFSKDKGLFEEHCLKELAFVCKKPESAKAKCYEITFDTIKIDKRIFYYSNNALMTWGEALMCCASREQRLISIATPIVGNLLANDFQTNKKTAGRHTGFKYGIWTSGNLVTEYNVRYNTTYEFASSYERIELKNNGENHYMQGPHVFDGECLQFVVDEGLMRSYILNNISCEFYRTFVCEEAEKFKIHNATWLTDPEDQSVVYVNSTATWQEAYLACAAVNMTLLTIESEAENQKALKILEAAQSAGEDPWMIWMGATRIIGITLYPDFIWLSLNRTITYSNWVHGEPDKYYPHEWCVNGAAKDGDFVWDDIDCQQKMHFICRKNGYVPEDEELDEELIPLDYGYHCPFNPNKTYEEGQMICEIHDMQIAILQSFSDYLDIQSTLMFSADPYWQLFVTSSKGQFINVEFNNFTLSEDLWPDGAPSEHEVQPTECYVAYLLSLLVPRLTLKIVPCEDLYGFLCSPVRYFVNPGGRSPSPHIHIDYEQDVDMIASGEITSSNVEITITTNTSASSPKDPAFKDAILNETESEYIIFPRSKATHWYAAKKACIKENGELASLRSEEELSAIATLMSSEMNKSSKAESEYKGRKGGVYTSAVGATPWKKNGFQWSISGNNYPMSDYNVTDTLWAPGQPDNGDPLEQCTVIYLLPGKSLNTFGLAMDDVQCREKRGYICIITTPVATPVGRRSMNARKKGKSVQQPRLEKMNLII